MDCVLIYFHKANYPLMKTCIKFYHQYREKYNCERGNTKHGALASILICLEKAIQDGNGYLLCCIFITDKKNVFCKCTLSVLVFKRFYASRFFIKLLLSFGSFSSRCYLLTELTM